MPTFNVNDDISLYYEITGTGSPLLMIHGFMGTGATQFPALREHMSKTYQVIAPDLRGYGKSTPKPRPYGVDFYRNDAEDLAALLEHLPAENVTVMGFSDGGETALWLPLLAPDRIRSVIVWGAIGHFDERIRPHILDNLAMRWRTPEMDVLHGAEHIPMMAQRWVHAMLGVLDRGGDVTFSRAGEITCPVLVMLGDRDGLNPLDKGQAMANAIPKGEFAAFKKTGHPIHRERPRQFIKTVERFLKKT